MKAASTAVALRSEEVRFKVEMSTAQKELSSTEAIVGQERAQSALQLGTGIKGNGYNIYVSGLTGADRLAFLKEWIEKNNGHDDTPGDRLYVHNFKYPDEPIALYLRAGMGLKLKQMMHDLVRSLREELPKAFRQEAFDREKSLLKEKYTHRSQELGTAFERTARDKGFLMQPGPNDGILFIPLVDNKPISTPEEYSKLDEKIKEEFSRKQGELAVEMEKMARSQQELIREMEHDILEIEKRFCENIMRPLINKISQEIGDESCSAYLENVAGHILENLDDFKEAPAAPQMPFALAAMPGAEKDPFLEYEVNIVVDNSSHSGPPVIVEGAPGYMKLFGTIERVVDRFGRLVTNFTRIKSGSMLRAHGGYLIFNLEDAVTEPAVWKTLKRTMRSGTIEMDTYEPFAIFSTSGLKPASVQIDVKVIVVGSYYLYQLLYALDEDFKEIFKVHADFQQIVDNRPEYLNSFNGIVNTLTDHEKLPPMDQSGIERLIEFAARQAEDRNRILASPSELKDVVLEAGYEAQKTSAANITGAHVELALEKRVYRSGWIKEEIKRLIVEGTILIEVQGKKTGQVNGLSVSQIGNFSFGRPFRVTASASMGTAGIINVERESNLGGNIHNKGMLILSGYIRSVFGQKKPLALSASVCFEQSYSGVEGDSASSTELYAILSRLSGVPIRQDLAVTGSVNQKGEIQAIGGVNEKIEGFFDVCSAMTLTGTQGVVIPASNIKNLVLRKDIVRAVEEGRFAIYPVRTIAEGMEILTGVRYGKPGDEGTICEAVMSQLVEYAEGLKSFNAEKPAGASST